MECTFLDFEHYMCAKFHFVDLAGSERVSRTGNVGERFKGDAHFQQCHCLLIHFISDFCHQCFVCLSSKMLYFAIHYHYHIFNFIELFHYVKILFFVNIYS